MDWVSPVLLSPPSAILSSGAVALSSGQWNGDLWMSALAFCGSLGLGLVVGAGTGILMGISPVIFHLLNPYVVAMNTLPKIVLCPLIMLWFGTGMEARIFLGTTMAAFPIMMSTLTGVQSIDKDFLTLAKVYNASRQKIWTDILLPAVAPYVLSGMRVGVNYAMVGVLIVEFFASSEGVGFRLNAYAQNFQTELFFVLLGLVVSFVLIFSSLVHKAERHFGGWRHAAFH